MIMVLTELRPRYVLNKTRLHWTVKYGIHVTDSHEI